ncbi:MAG: cupin domain-containing protein [Xanthobacteraceae bacterium]
MPLTPPAAKFADLARMLTSAQNLDLKGADLHDLAATRRGLMLAPLLAALPAALLAGPAHAVDPSETQVTLPDQMQWKPWSAGGVKGAMESAAVFGATDKPGPYAILVRWHPGYMSAPHSYVTDRLCFVISGTWWVNSGETFEPENTVPAPAGSFVRRVAHTPHYDGVRKGGNEPAVIGIIGVAPIELKLVDPSKPPVREV